MLSWIRSWFAHSATKPDDRPPRNDEAGRLLEMDEPMAAAGAMLSGTHIKSETEKALEETTELGSSGER